MGKRKQRRSSRRTKIRPLLDKDRVSKEEMNIVLIHECGHMVIAYLLDIIIHSFDMHYISEGGKVLLDGVVNIKTEEHSEFIMKLNDNKLEKPSWEYTEHRLFCRKLVIYFLAGPLIEAAFVGKDITDMLNDPAIAEDRNEFRTYMQVIAKPEYFDNELESLIIKTWNLMATKEVVKAVHDLFLFIKKGGKSLVEGHKIVSFLQQQPGLQKIDSEDI